MAADHELINRLKNLEDNFTERKPEGIKSTDIRKAIVAFSNSVSEGRTAILYIGVRDNGDIQGVRNPDSLQKTIRTICENECYPPIQPRIEVLPIQGQSVLAVVISQSVNRPHFSGPAYVRIGSESISASESIFNELITSRLEKPYEILKWKGKAVTVITKLSKYEHFVQECEVKSCTPHYVVLRDTHTDRYRSDPLENIMLVTDENKGGRLKLIIGGKSYQSI